ncbi:MAG: DUF1080 domain-containing protein [Planctomycetota bacterium]|nr:DUF1080 domain-containing protein [Planctomycetota bacterium]
MSRLPLLLIACLVLTGAAFAAAPTDEAVQGIYEGTVKAGAGEQKAEARLAACGKGTYKLFIRIQGAEKAVSKIDLDGKAEGDAVAFKGKAGDAEWTAAWAADGTVKGAGGKNGKLELKRIVRESPTLGAKPPAGAIVLLGDKIYDGVTKKPLKDGKEQEWTPVDGGGILVPKGGMTSKQPIAGSFKMHVEFKNPLMPDARGQGRGNSGVYLPNGEEIQVLDSFGMDTYTGGCCGGIYKYKDPDLFDVFPLASLPPLQWQTYDIEYRVQVKDGKPTGKPHVTVLHNGLKIHDNFEMQKDAKAGNIFFQDHGNAVHYRNIWVQPLEDK